MKKHDMRLVVAAFTFALLTIFTALVFFTNSTQAAAPSVKPPGPGGAGAGTSAPKPQQPNASSWVDIAPFPTVTIDFTPGPTSLRLKRAGAACYAPNGKCYVMGGRHGTDGEDISMRNIWEYSPGSPGTWLTKTALLDTSGPGERYTANMAVAVLTDATGSRIYAIGGSSINSTPAPDVRAYNPVADSLTTISSDPWPASPARIPGGYAVYNNKLYIFGGFNALGSGAVFTDTWVFDPNGASGAKWAQIATANLNLGRAYIAGATLDGKIYAVGGDTWNPSTRVLLPQTNVEVLDPSAVNPSWSNSISLPVPLGDMSAWAYDTGTGYEISGRIMVAGGKYPIPDSKAYILKPGVGWSSFPDLLHATRNYGAAQLNGTLYAFGGYDYSNNIPSGANFSQRYDATGAVPTVTSTPALSPTPTNTP